MNKQDLEIEHIILLNKSRNSHNCRHIKYEDSKSMKANCKN